MYPSFRAKFGFACCWSAFASGMGFPFVIPRAFSSSRSFFAIASFVSAGSVSLISLMISASLWSSVRTGATGTTSGTGTAGGSACLGCGGAWCLYPCGLLMQSQAQLMISPASAPMLVSCGYIIIPPGRENGSYWSTTTPSISSWLARVFPRPLITHCFVNGTSSVLLATSPASAMPIMPSVWAIRLHCQRSSVAR